MPRTRKQLSSVWMFRVLDAIGIAVVCLSALVIVVSIALEVYSSHQHR